MNNLGSPKRASGSAHDLAYLDDNRNRSAKPARRRAAVYCAEALESRTLLSSVVASNAGSAAIDLAISPDAGATMMEIDRSIDNSNFTPIYTGGAVTTFHDSGLTPSTNFYYAISDTDTDGNLLGSASANAATAPAAPTFSLSNSGSAAVQLSSISCGAATSMAVYESQNMGGWWSAYSLAYSGAVQSSLAITGLAANTSYSCSLAGTDSNNNTSDNSAAASITTAPPAPTFNVTSTGSASAQFSISYDTTSVTGIQVYQSTDNATWSLAYNGAAQYSLLISGLNSDTTYYFYLTASNSSGPSDPSATATAITKASSPSLGVSSAGSTSVAASIAYDSTATTMDIYDRVSYYGAWSLAYSGGVQNNCTIAGLSPNTQYDFYATVANSNGDSDFSQIATTTTAPAAPTFSAAASGSTTVQLSSIAWGGASTSMNVYVSNDNSNWYLAYSGGLETSCTISGLSSNTPYDFFITDANGNGTSDPSSTASATTDPAAPTFSASSSGSTAALISGINCDASATSMQIYYGNGSTWTLGYSGGIQSSATITGLASDRDYQFYMIDANGVGSSDPSATASATTGASAPTLTVSSSGSSSVLASISYDTAAASMLIESSTDGSTWSPCYSGGVQNSCTITGLTADTLYYFRASVSNSAGTSDPSSPASTTVAPAAPTFSLAGSGSTTLQLSSIACDSQATEMAVYVSTSNWNWYLAYSGAVQTSCTISGLAGNTVYDVYATDGNVNGISDNSSTIVATTMPAPPSISVNCTGSSSVNVAVMGADSSATAMAVYYSPDDSTWTQAYSGIMQSSIQITGLSPDTLYTFRATDSNSNGVSDFSSTTTCSTAPTAPSFTLSGATSTTIQLSSIATDPLATDMQVYFSTTGSAWTTAYTGSVQGTYTITSLAPSMQYFIGVTDSAGYCTSDLSTIATITTHPAAPSFWVGGVSRSSILLPGIAFDSATQLQAYISTDNTNWTLAYDGSAEGSITIAGLSSGTPYFVYLTGTNSQGVSDASSVASGTTESVTSRFTATPVNDGSVDLEWGLTVSDWTTAIAVQRSTNATSGFSTIANLAGDNIFYMDSDPALADGAHYYYRLEVTDLTGTYDSQPVDAWTAPAAPENLQATATGTTQVSLSWQNASANAIGFQIGRAGEDGVFHTIDSISGSYAIGDDVAYTDNTAAINTTYTYQVQTIGNGGLSDPPTVTGPVTTLAAVDSLAVNAISTTAIDVSWNVNATDATAVVVERSTDGTNFTALPVSLDGTATIYHDTGLLANTDYWYRVRVIEPAGPSAYTDPSDAVTYPLLENVEAAAAATNSMNLQWTLDVTDATSIDVQRSSDGASFSTIATLSGSATDYADTTVTENNHYWYRVRATGPTGESGFSPPVDVWTLPLQELTATAASVGEIDLSWSNISTDATAVEIDRSTGGGDFTLLTDTLPGTATGFSDAGLTENSDYSYRVRAIEPGGPSGFSSPAETSTLAAVDSLSATAVSANEIDLSWNLNAADATGIEVARSTDGTNFTALTPTLSATATTFNDTGLDENTPYYYQVRATQPGGASSYTDSASALTLPSVSGLAAGVLSTSDIELTWTLNTTDATAIEVDRSDDGITFSPLTTTYPSTLFEYDDSGLTEGMQYYYQVRAIGSSGSSAFTDPAVATTEPIQNLTTTPGSTSQVLSWSNRSPTATAVEVDQSTDGMNYTPLTTTLPGYATTYTATGLTPDTPYWYQVRAIEPGGPSDYTDPAATFSLPVAPTGLTATAVSSGEVDLSWTNNAASSVSYQIERMDPGQTDYTVIDTTDPGATSYQDTTVLDGGSYSYCVAAVSQDGINSAASDPASATTQLLAPTGLTATANGPYEVDLSWDDSSQYATEYTIEYSTDGGNTFQVLNRVDETSYIAYASPGTQYVYRVSAINDDSDANSPVSDTASVATPPVISLSGDTYAAEGATDHFSTGTTYDQSGPDPVTGYNINWGDGSTETIDGDPSTIPHVFLNPGTYTVSAVTTDGAASTTVSVNVQLSAGSLSVTWPPVTEDTGTGGSASFTATFTHPAGHAVTAWYVNWEDGEATEIDAADATDATNATTDTRTFTHTYNPGFPADPVISAVNDQGVSQWGATLYSGGYDSGTAGVENAGFFFDDSYQYGDPGDIGRPYTDHFYTTDWGNGQTTTGALALGSTGTEFLAGDVRYDDAGFYPVIVSVTKYPPHSTTGTTSLVAGGTETIADPVPVITPADQTVAAGQSVDVTIPYTGFCASGTGIAFIDWGDGTGPHPATFSGGITGTITAHLDHAPPAGDYNATISFYDSANSFGSLIHDGTNTPETTATFTLHTYSIDFTIAGDLSAAQRATDEDGPGAPAIVDNNDLNGNGIADYAEWANGGGLPADTHFVHGTLSIPAFADLSTTTVEFDYAGSDPTSDGAPTAPLRLWLKDATDSRTAGDYIAPGTQYTASALPFASASSGYVSLTIFVEAAAPTTAPKVPVTAKVTLGSPASQPGAVSNVAYVTPVGANLNIIKTDGSGNAVAPDSKNTAGGYVVLNDDNDNGKYTMDPPPPRPANVPLASVTPTPDDDYKGTTDSTIPGEHDLTEISIETRDTGAAFELIFNQQDLRVWMNPDRSPGHNLSPNGDNIFVPQVISDKTVFYVSAGILKLYVEGIGIQNPVDGISLMCSFPEQGVPWSWETVDQVAFHVFQVAGPQYVPGFGTYNYSASTSGSWSYDTGNGTFAQGNDTDVDGTQDVTFVGGPAIGAVRFSPAPGFLATRRVYVVGVTVDTGRVTPNRAPAAAQTAAGVGEGKYEVTTSGGFAANPTESIAFESRVSLRGPIDPNLHSQRGIPYMQVGYAQTVTLTSFNATYTNGPTIHSPMQGHTYTDGGVDRAGTQTTVYPWYDSAQGNGPSVIGGLGAGASRTPISIKTKDRPSVSLFQIYQLHTLQSAVVKWDFSMNVIDRTLDSGQGNVPTYWLKATIAWFTDFSGASSVRGAPPVAGFPPYVPATSDPASGGSAVWTAGNAAVFSTGPGIDGSAFNPPVGPLGSVLMKNNANIANWISG